MTGIGSAWTRARYVAAVIIGKANQSIQSTH